MNPDFKKILQQARTYRPAMSEFLREIIAIPSESTRESAVVRRIGREMEAVGFDRVETDGMGNLLAYMGSGSHLIAMDAHIDTVGVGNRANWDCDPYQGYEDEEVIVGRGASDQKGGLAALVYGGKIIKDLSLDGDYTLLVTATVQEEDCDGLCWQYIIEKGGIRPEFVVSTEPTACNIHRGQRGRMEIQVRTSGVSCHGSAPERGDNAIFKMAPILTELQSLHGRLKDHPFLGKGSLTVSEISSTSPSRCAVADGCTLSIDRRLTLGETWEGALEEIRRLASVQKAGARVGLYDYDRPAYTGLVYPTQCHFPAWVLEEDHAVCRCLMACYQGLFGRRPLVDKWTFSTNGVSIMGRYGIPCIGFGPGHEDQAHAPNERTWKAELVTAAAMYAAIPSFYVRKYQ